MKITQNNITPEQGQVDINEMIANLHVEINRIYILLNEKIKKFQTFNLLSNISYYNHLHDANTYSDFRGDRKFIISEVVALLCLKNEFIPNSLVVSENFNESIKEIQDLANKYCMNKMALNFVHNHENTDENVVIKIADLLANESSSIRNLGHPDIHLLFTEKLFFPINKEIKNIFGFSISDTVIIRKKLPQLVNKKCSEGLDTVEQKINQYYEEIIQFRKSQTVSGNNIFTKEQLEEYSLNSNKVLKAGLLKHLYDEYYSDFSEVYTFTQQELSEATNLDIDVIEAFLAMFSCGFPSLIDADEIYAPVTILKSKPIIRHNHCYLIPSFPLLIWAVEDVISNELFIPKKYSDQFAYEQIRHDFLLKEALAFFKILLPTATFLPPNLKYIYKEKNCETDAMFLFDRTLFILEAKGHRITDRAKSGKIDRTEKHLTEMIKKSYDQGIRTLQYIRDNESIEFSHTKGKVSLSNAEFDEVIIISSVIEPIGGLAVNIKATNEIDYFTEGHFPWIISIYDLAVIADLFENPFLLLLYIKKRKQILSNPQFHTFEELDLISYFFENGLTIENQQNSSTELDKIVFAPNTDEINDYYMYKFGHKLKVTLKPKFNISKYLNNLLLSIDNSKLIFRVKASLLLLELDAKILRKVMKGIKATKEVFAKGKKTKACTIYQYQYEGLGITYLVATNINDLEIQLNMHRANIIQNNDLNDWIGIGDISENPYLFDIQCIVLISKATK